MSLKLKLAVVVSALVIPSVNPAYIGDTCPNQADDDVSTVLSGCNEFGFNESSRFNESVFYLKFFYLKKLWI